MKQFGIAIAALLILSVACTSFLPKEAGAFNLVRIMEFLTPLAQQFGIEVNTNETVDVVVAKSISLDESVSDSEWDTPEEYVYDDIDDVPQYISIYPTIPTAVPEGFTFKSADYYSDLGLTNLCLTYANDQMEFNIQISVYGEGIGYSSMLAESNAELKASNEITVSENHGIYSVFMETEFGAYQIWGAIPKEDLITMMNGYKGEIEDAKEDS